MSRKSLTILLTLARAIVFGLFLMSSKQDEPTFKGKTLLTWLTNLDSEVPETKSTAETAIRDWGTNVIPYLIALFNSGDSWLKSEFQFAMSQQRIVQFRVDNSQYTRFYHASRGFEVLGQEGKPAFSNLVRFLDDWHTSQSAARALAALGADSVPVLVRAFTGTNAWIRQNAATALIDLGTNAHAAVPALVEWVKREESEGRAQAADVLGHIGVNPLLVVPCLIEAAQEIRTPLRYSAIEALGRFGGTASEAVPVLLNLATNTNPKLQELRRYAIRALKEIDAEAVAGLKSP